jgi:hypothetical protein
VTASLLVEGLVKRLESAGYPPWQIMAIAEALAGERPKIPMVDAGAAFKRAARETKDTQENLDL